MGNLSLVHACPFQARTGTSWSHMKSSMKFLISSSSGMLPGIIFPIAGSLGPELPPFSRSADMAGMARELEMPQTALVLDGLITQCLQAKVMEGVQFPQSWNVTAIETDWSF